MSDAMNDTLTELEHTVDTAIALIDRLQAENKRLREHIAELEAELEEPEPVSWLAKPEEKKERDPDEWREWEHEKERIRKEFGE